MTDVQLDLELPPAPEARLVRGALLTTLKQRRMPSAEELVASIEESFGVKARWHIASTIGELVKLADLHRTDCDYLSWLMSPGNLDAALHLPKRRRARCNPDRGKDPLLDEYMRSDGRKSSLALRRE